MNEKIPVYELSISLQVGWQAHSMSNIGSKGSNRTMPRHQLLSDGTKTDACSGNIFKHYHAHILREHLIEKNFYLCPACRIGDNRRASAIEEDGLTMDTYLQCGLCDSHGFLIPEKKEGGEIVRQGATKHSLVEFSMALALPDQQSETSQIYTRQSNNSETGGQMIFKRPSRSGNYAQCIRYKAVGLGIDINTWKTITTNEDLRLKLHQAILESLGEQILSPSGALTSTMLAHLTELKGVFVIKTKVGRAPILSPLNQDFIVQTQQIANKTRLIFSFDTPGEFNQIIEDLIAHSYPSIPSQRQISIQE